MEICELIIYMTTLCQANLVINLKVKRLRYTYLLGI